MAVAVVRTGNLARPGTVDYRTTGPILPHSGTLAFAAGEASKDLLISAPDDALWNGESQHAQITLSNPTEDWVFGPNTSNQVSVTVLEDDVAAIGARYAHDIDDCDIDVETLRILLESDRCESGRVSITVHFPTPAPSRDVMYFLADPATLEGPFTIPVPGGATSVSFQALPKRSGDALFAVEPPSFLRTSRASRPERESSTSTR